MDAFDWLAHAIGQLYLAQPLTEVDFRKLKVRHPFMMHVTPLVWTEQKQEVMLTQRALEFTNMVVIEVIQGYITIIESSRLVRQNAKLIQRFDPTDIYLLTI